MMMKTNRIGFILTFVAVFTLVLIFTLVFGEDNLLVAALSALAFAVIFSVAYIGMATRLDQTSSKHIPPAGPSTPSSQLTEEDLSSVASKTVSNRDEPAKKEQKKAESSGPGGSAGEGYGGVPALDDHHQEPPKPHKPTQRPSPPPAPPPSMQPSKPVVVFKDSELPEEKVDIIDGLVLSQQEFDKAPPAETEAIPNSASVITERRRSTLDPDEEAKPALEPNPEVAEEVHFSLYHPKEVAPSKWYTLLTYVHVLDALEDVQQDAHKFRAEMAHDPREVKSRKTAKLMRGTELRLVPSAEGIEFNPPDLKLTWVEDYHRASFRFKANSDIVGEPANGEVAIYVGPLEIATIRFSIFVTDTPTEGEDAESQQAVQAAMYKRIFASYSHRDTAIVKACVAAFKSIGYDVLIDYETLRSGEIWSADLERMIDEADIFQLFWSPNSAESKYVRQEWERALSRTYGKAPGEGFIRPVYWLQPMPNVPNELGHLHFKFMEDLATLNDEQGS
ncbi:MAG: toll/interleukin-1 receptor domain-containing protein [Anaerolineales bacterium]|nr:toll/interleukin-1 receptor domain-containing protein [Anaerolineales bacterium]